MGSGGEWVTEVWEDAKGPPYITIFLKNILPLKYGSHLVAV